MRQPIDGFGFAITGSAAYNLLKMKPEERQALLIRIFSRSKWYGCSFVSLASGSPVTYMKLLTWIISDDVLLDTPGTELL